MARDVGTHLLRTLAAAGVILSEGLLMSLQAAYQREAEDAVADSYAVAAVNGLQFHRHQEELNVQTFLSALRGAIDEFHRDPLGPPLVPNWARVWAGMRDAGPQLIAAVAEGPADATVCRVPGAREAFAIHGATRVRVPRLLPTASVQPATLGTSRSPGSAPELQSDSAGPWPGA